ncbi:MAG TPA: hypothetical protein VFP87_05110, partial [Chitinophagaceae bacterium]|nr:hypothetical protein [Chitinophagaceae bacterium]
MLEIHRTFPFAHDGYSGDNRGEPSNYATFSTPAETITAPDFPALLLDYSEVESFLRKQCREDMRLVVPRRDIMANAVTVSILYWGGTAAQAA